MKKHLLLLFVSLLLGAARVSAQPIYPVTVAPQVMPPTPLYLSSLAEASYSYDPVRVQLLLNDLAIPNRQVRLKIYIEGNGYAAQSRDFVVGATPLVLNSGLPLQLTHVDLAPYFAFQNLAGISPAQYAQALPEGLYQVCFEVYDAVSQARLSAKSCANTVIFRNNPPLLVAPARGVVVQEQNPPFIVFQWTPRHLNVSNVEYELSLVEVWDTGVDPQAAFLASPPLFTAATRTTSYVYGPTDPMLLAGKTYAWRVRARALVGADEVGLFVNNGYSEVFSFRYVSPCTAPQQVSAQQVSANMATVGWSETGRHLDYTVQYREKGNANWYTNTTPRNYLTINGLKPETAYQFQVAGNCEGGAATTSPVYEFTTLNREEAGYQGCNIDIAATNIANRQPLAQLFPGDLIMAGDFPVTVTQVEKNTPPFKGKGYTFISWLGDTKIGVEFTNITVNTDNQLISGEIKTTYDPTWGNVSFLSDIVDLSNGQAQEINFDRPIERVYINGNGQVVVVIQDAGGQNVEVEYPGGKDYVIKGSDGKVYQVDEEGNITQGTEAEGGASTAANTQGVDSNGHVTQLSATGVKVFFEPAPNTVYGFDTLPAGQPALTSHYRSVPDGAGGSYPVIHKAVQNQATDALYARVQLTGASVKAEDVKFKTKAGVALTAEVVAGSPNTYRLSVSGISNFEKEEVQAYLLPKTEGGKQTIAGLFDLYSLGQKSVNVTLIPVNGASLDKNALEEQLNDIYRPAAVQFNLTIGSPFTVNPSDFDANGDSKLEIGTSNWLSTYTAEQLAIIDQFKAAQPIAEQMHYVFVCNNISTSRPVEGFMPLLRRYGFVFANAIGSGNDSNKEENKGSLAKVLAHELGHGAFGLRHPFVVYGTEPETTNFLMDYGGGTALSHLDWEQLHDPNFKLYLFQEDEEGEHFTETGAFPAQFLNSDKESFSFVSPTGNYIDVPKNVKDVTFTFGIYDYEKSKNIVTGCLYSFKIGEDKYTLNTDGAGSQGYFKSGNKYSSADYFKNNTKYKGYEGSIVMGLPNTPKFIIGKFKAEGLQKEGTSTSILDESNFTIIPFSTRNTLVGTLKQYSYNEAAIGENAYQLNTAYTQLLGSHNNKETLITVLKIIQLANAYKESYRRFDKCISEAIDNAGKESSDWYTVANEIFNWTVDTQSAIDCRLEIIPNAAALLANNDVKTYYNTYLQKFKEYIENNAADCSNYFSTLTENSSVGSLENCLSLLSDDDIRQISIDKKLLAISLLLNNWKVDDSQERQLIRLIKYTRDSDVDALLDGLNSKSVLTGVNDFLIKKLVYKTDNDHTFFHEDNYKTLIYTLVELTVAKSQKFRSRLANLSEDDLVERNIKFYYKSFWDTVFADWSVLWNFINGESLYSYDTKTAWSSGENTDLSIHTDIYLGNDIIGSTHSVQLPAFDPIYFTNKSGLSMLSDYNRDKPVLSPAIAAYYAHDVGNTQAIVDGIQATVDVLSLASGYGALARAPGLVRKTFIIADMIGSGVSLTQNAARDNLSPEANAFLNALNILTATVAVTEIGTNAKNLKEIFSKVKAQGGGLPSKAAANEFLGKLIAADGKLDGLDPNKLKESKVWVAQLEMEAKLGNVDDLKDKITQAKRVLTNAAEGGYLAKYVNIRKYLGSSRIKQYLNTDQLYAFEAIIRSAHPDVLKYMDELDEFDFAQVVSGYRDLLNGNNLSTFTNAVKSADGFYGKYDGWFNYWKLTPGIKYSMTTIEDLRAADKLLPTGNATDLQLSYLQAFTRKGDFINVPLRYDKEHFLGEFGQKGLDNITQCLDELKKIPERQFKGEVFSGKTFSKADFETRFVGGTGKSISYESFVSTSLEEEVAGGFIDLTAKHAGEGEKIAVIQRIIVKDGVYIDDISDWGKNLGKTRHYDSPEAIQIQKEVLLNAGTFKQMAEPIPIKNAQGEQIKIGGYLAYYLDLIQL